MLPIYYLVLEYFCYNSNSSDKAIAVCCFSDQVYIYHVNSP